MTLPRILFILLTFSVIRSVSGADLEAPAAPFYSEETVRKTPELFQETKKFGSRSFRHFGFRCGDLTYSVIPDAEGIPRSRTWELHRF